MTQVTRDGRVCFRFFRRNARSVKVAGDFNGWAADRLEMKSEGDGWWSTETLLKSGEYRFRYVVDGAWFTDYAAHGIEYKGLGINSVLVVPRKEVSSGISAAVVHA